jgi:hypothetical protein
MRYFKIGMMFIILVASMFLVSCSDVEDSQGNVDSGKVFDKIVSIGKLEFVTGFEAGGASYSGVQGENELIGLMRILIGILVFTLFYWGASNIPGLRDNNRAIPVVISLVLAIISVIFIPGKVLAGIGGAYGTLVGFVLMGIPIFIGGMVLYLIPADNRWLISFRIIIILLMIWILRAVVTHAKDVIQVA